jgi:hypothetical protein
MSTPLQDSEDVQPGAMDAFALDDASQRALDALFAERSGEAPEPRGDIAESIARVRNLLGVLDVPHEQAAGDAGRAETLIDLTLARIARHDYRQRAGGGAGEPEWTLCADDEDAFELLVAAGMDLDAVPSRVRERCQRQMALLDMLESGAGGDAVAGAGVADRPLVSMTLSRIEQASHSAVGAVHGVLRLRGEGEDVVPEPLRRRMLSSRRVSDVIAVAAMLLIAGSVIMPVLSSLRQASQRTLCAGNLSAAGLGFGLYAGDYRDSLPMASASLPGSAWWNVGTPESSNSANLFTLVRTNYSAVADLACPGNSAAVRELAKTASDWRGLDEVSYSYQNMFATERPRWTQATTTVIVADRSPIVPLAQRGQLINPVSNSLNHASGGEGRGQWLLQNDGSVRFVTTPVLENGDNIYLPRVIESAITRLQNPREAKPLTGRESPAGADDVFLGP